MHKRIVLMAAALLSSCGGSTPRIVDVLAPVAAGLRQCSPSPRADTQDGNCSFEADGKVTVPDPRIVTSETVIVTAADGTVYSSEQRQIPAAYLVENLDVHIEATLMKNNGACAGSCAGLRITINTISR